VRHDGLSLPTGAALPSVGARERFCFCLCFAPTCKHFSSTIWSSVSPRISFFLSADGDRCARRAEIDAACQVVRGMNLSLSLSLSLFLCDLPVLPSCCTFVRGYWEYSERVFFGAILCSRQIGDKSNPKRLSQIWLNQSFSKLFLLYFWLKTYLNDIYIYI
jgi:hypothetical protein